MIETETATKAHTGRCPRKGCRYAKQVFVPMTGTVRTPNGRVLPAVTRLDMDRAITVPQPGGPPAYLTCPEHGSMLQWSAIKGRYDQGSKCDARCTGAIGHECECECGGTNHGLDHR